MPLTEVSDAIYYYLKPENSNINYLGTLYQALPKTASEADLFTKTFAGQAVGAVIYQFCTGQRETRKAVGGQHSGRKMRVYDMGFLIVFKSDLPSTEDAQQIYFGFIDELTAYIQADRNAGTESPSLGGTGPYAGTGYVWQFGEGTELGGVDIQIDHAIPRTADGGVVLFQSVMHLSAIEWLNT